MARIYTTEITSDQLSSDNPLHQRLLKPYISARQWIKGDLLDEIDERFLVKLSNPINATFADSEARCTITDDDAAPLNSDEEPSSCIGHRREPTQ